MARFRFLALFLAALQYARAFPVDPAAQSPFAAGTATQKPHRDAKVLVLGGGMAGITAARTLYDQGISEFIVIEARHELGGRMMSHTLGQQYTVELGANWVQGTQKGDGPENPIWTLAKKHGLRMKRSSYFDGLSAPGDIPLAHFVKGAEMILFSSYV